ncbi:type II toxin-antitoxin system PemK/MazF family toxin [Cytobacillus kochii]|uniref:type II toxin-antitoxin system PemK/MazF family toxin n=1 Tax=Cytobacillus kochii TaxID=859143 RepID=UPI00203F6BA1|nr:type II toxin-antitoxin system PemK/MazF family toxin [Cytobacillus kochii]MCM3323278.1 type II toxin-antitoxin system PemK/MazF family toxin [Cytobacillus kochii]MCM3345673.1 type II toxin-antitoxin system PemK/MazF family toxin [Cytobacillus kochii]
MKKQGYLYWGNVQNNESVSGKRPFLVLSKSQTNNEIVVAPLRSIKSLTYTQVPISSKRYPLKDGTIFLEQVTSIKAEYLGEEICELQNEEVSKIKEGLKILFSL